MEKLIDIILNDVSERRFEDAVNNCNLLISQYPVNPVAYELRGDCYFKMKKYEHASLNYTEAIELSKPKTKQDYDLLSSVYNKRGLCNLSIGNFNESLNDFKNAIKNNSDNSEAYNNRAKAYRKKENYTEAIKDCSKAIALDPNFAEAYNNRGNIYYLMSKSQQAINDYTLAIKIKPDYAGAYYNRGSAFYFLANNNKDAMSDWEKAVALNDSYKDELNPKINELKKILSDPESNKVLPPIVSGISLVTAENKFKKVETTKPSIEELPVEKISEPNKPLPTPEAIFATNPFTDSENFYKNPFEMPSETEKSVTEETEVPYEPELLKFEDTKTSFDDIFSEGKIDVSNVELPVSSGVQENSSFSDVFMVDKSSEDKSLHLDYPENPDIQKTDLNKPNEQTSFELPPTINEPIPVLPESVVKLHNEITGEGKSESTYNENIKPYESNIPITNEYIPPQPSYDPHNNLQSTLVNANEPEQPSNINPAESYGNLMNNYGLNYQQKPKRNLTIGIIVAAAVLIIGVLVGVYFLLQSNLTFSGIFGGHESQYELLTPKSDEDTKPDTNIKNNEKITQEIPKQEEQSKQETIKKEEPPNQEIQKTEEPPKQEPPKTETKKNNTSTNVDQEISNNLKVILDNKHLIVVKTDDGKYWIQAGSFKDKSIAEKLKNKLLKSNSNVQIVETDLPDKGKFYRVRIGGFVNLVELEKNAKKIEL